MYRTISAVIGVALACVLAVPATAKAPDLSARIDRAVKLAQRADRHAAAAYALALSASGKAGPQGEQGAQGIRGDTGPRGATGDTGAKGDAGTNGTNGTNGHDGAPGIQGPQGLQGMKGDTGSTGPAGSSGVAAYGYVSATGTGTTTQGATVTHPGNGLYCLTAPGLTALVVTPDTYGVHPFVYRPGAPGSSCSGERWMVVVPQDNGNDAGFTFLGE